MTVGIGDVVVVFLADFGDSVDAVVAGAVDVDLVVVDFVVAGIGKSLPEIDDIVAGIASIVVKV